MGLTLATRRPREWPVWVIFDLCDALPRTAGLPSTAERPALVKRFDGLPPDSSRASQMPAAEEVSRCCRKIYLSGIALLRLIWGWRSSRVGFAVDCNGQARLIPGTAPWRMGC